MSKKKSIELCIIGAGRVGTTLGYIFSKGNFPGIKLKAISSRTDKSLKRAKKIIDSKSQGIIFTKNNREAAFASNCVLICTPDDAIESVCKEIFKGPDNKSLKDYCVIHFSGSKKLGVLESAGVLGAGTASIHPMKSFASIGEAIKTMPGTIFGVTCSSSDVKKTAGILIEKLDGEIIEVEDEKKPLYHAAACIASNYLVTLLNYAAGLYKKIGMSSEDSLKGIMSLVDGTIDNVKKLGTEKSLTGPIARGDLGTIREHIKSMEEQFLEEELRLYKIMGVETGKLAGRNGWIEDDILNELKKILGD
jgi:predicted short-subunit dehydrogenase-like oxidoreductase (DUF2520 family)